jgi:hypothetical protein
MKTALPILTAAALVLGVLVVAGCDSADSGMSTIDGSSIHADNRPAVPAPATLSRELAAARAATARFQRVQVAEMADYEQGSPCVEHPVLGGMGYHWVNFGLMGGLDVTKPQALLYEPMSNGRLRLVGLEWIMPFSADAPADGPPPVLFGQEFHHGPPGWILHVWVWTHNPSGMFEDWNPNVSCQYAD